MKPKRLYKGADSYMLERIETMLAEFEKYQADFEAMDAGMDASFLANWKTAMDNARKSLSDSYEVAEGEIMLATALTALQKCQLKYKDVKYFAGKAFPGNKQVLREFGEGTYLKVRYSPLRMVQFMEALHGVATKYNTELIASGYSQAAIDEIATLTGELREDNKAQQLKKKERPTETRKRIERLNTFYSFGQQAAGLAQLIYANNYARLHMFRLAAKQAAERPATWLKLAASEKRKISLTRLLKKFSLTLTNQGPESIEYWQAENKNETPAQKQLLTAGAVVAMVAEVPAKKFLLLKNISAKEVRVMLRKENKE